MTTATFAPGFRRRIYRHPRELAADLAYLVRHLGDVVELSRKGGIAAEFRERLMLVITGVNRCRHCAYGHRILARLAGLSKSDIAALLTLDLESCPEHELPGLRYAIHWAESDGRPSADARSFLVETYGPDMARRIEMACLLIQAGNRFGNTFDFLLARLTRGRFGLLPDER